jgi:hypothetical protein
VNFTRFVASCSIAWFPLIIGCASSSETDLATQPQDAGKDVAKDSPFDVGSGGTGGAKEAGQEAATGGAGGSGGGSCNVDFCPTPAPPASKCCVTSNGPCGVDYGQGQGCQGAGTGGGGP